MRVSLGEYGFSVMHARSICLSGLNELLIPAFPDPGEYMRLVASGAWHQVPEIHMESLGCHFVNGLQRNDSSFLQRSELDVRLITS
jgi:hypothetical protein